MLHVICIRLRLGHFSVRVWTVHGAERSTKSRLVPFNAMIIIITSNVHAATLRYVLRIKLAYLSQSQSAYAGNPSLSTDPLTPALWHDTRDSNAGTFKSIRNSTDAKFARPSSEFARGFFPRFEERRIFSSQANFTEKCAGPSLYQSPFQLADLNKRETVEDSVELVR